jgi:transcriptional regulator with PAS, ATPase and Fis domain
MPPLRNRQDDLNPVIDHILESISKKFEDKPGWKHKILSDSARNLLFQYPGAKTGRVRHRRGG